MNQLEALRDTIRLAVDRGMAEAPGSELGLAHLRSMVARVEEGVVQGEFSDAKLGRWLGWAQCAVVAANVGVTLEDMKALNVRHSVRGG